MRSRCFICRGKPIPGHFDLLYLRPTGQPVILCGRKACETAYNDGPHVKTETPKP
jgi:hypothetical protein